jgi:hypothetical protein
MMPKFSEYPDMPPDVEDMIDWLLNAEHGGGRERCRAIASKLFDGENCRTSGIHVVQETTKRIAALEAELAAVRADAERYRWLRDMDEDPVMSLAARYTDCYGSAISISKRIDAAIDKAREGE